MTNNNESKSSRKKKKHHKSKKKNRNEESETEENENRSSVDSSQSNGSAGTGASEQDSISSGSEPESKKKQPKLKKKNSSKKDLSPRKSKGEDTALEEPVVLVQQQEEIIVENSEPELPKESLTSEQALSKLEAQLREVIEAHKPKSWKRDTLLKYLKQPLTLLSFATMCLLLVSFILYIALEDKLYERIIIEIILLGIVLILNGWIFFKEEYEKTFQLINKAESHLDRLNQDPLLELEIESGMVIPTISISTVFRDNKWIKIPTNHVVDGDIIGLSLNDKSQLRVKCIEKDIMNNDKSDNNNDNKSDNNDDKSNNDDDIILNKDDILSIDKFNRIKSINNNNNKSTSTTSTTFNMEMATYRLKFISLETPSVNQLKQSISHLPSKPRSPLENRIMIIQSILSWSFWITLLLSFIINLLRFFIQEYDSDNNNNYKWITLLLLRQGYLMIPSLCLSLHAIIMISITYCNSNLLSLFHILQEKTEENSKNIHSQSLADFDEIDPESQKDEKIIIPSGLIKNYFITIMRNLNSSVSLSSSRLIHVFGSATVICCVDQDGVLSESSRIVEKVLLPKEESNVILGMSRIPNPINTGGVYGLLKFDEMDWENSLMSLKPLGLNCLLNKNCNVLNKKDTSYISLLSSSNTTKNSYSPSLMSLECLKQLEDPDKVYEQCTCLLGKEIGFTDDALDSYVRVKEIHTFSPFYKSSFNYISDKDDLDQQKSEQLSEQQQPEQKEQQQLLNDNEQQQQQQEEQQEEEEEEEEEEHGYMLSLIIKESNSGSLQLLSKGSTELIIDNCTSYWDGESIKPLTSSVKQDIIRTYIEWIGKGERSCISYSYKPIDKRYKSLFNINDNDSDSDNSNNSNSNSDNDDDADIKKSKKKKKQSHSNHRNTSSPSSPSATTTTAAAAAANVVSPVTIHLHKSNSILTIEDAINESVKSNIINNDINNNNNNNNNDQSPSSSSDHHTSTMIQRKIRENNLQQLKESSDIEDKESSFKTLQREQIFIGMISMRQLPKMKISQNIQSLRGAGIRFVVFSNDSDYYIKMFADKLGLETDWNCCISLQETEDGSARPKLDENESHLPRGISSIRKHLEEDIDNVPLLVPMFSDASNESKAEMIKIFQDYGEVVCCIGSSLNHDNTFIFSQSDLSIGIEPSLSVCLNRHPDNEQDILPLLSSKNFYTHNSTLSFSCDMNTLPCSIVSHRETPFEDYLKLFEQGRYLMGNLQQCLFIYLYNILWVHITLLSSYLLLPSYYTILDGIQLLWLLWIIIPLLSIPILFSNYDIDLMDLMPDKNKHNIRKILKAGGFILIKQLISIIICLIIYVWSIYLLLNGKNSDININGGDINNNNRITISDILNNSNNSNNSNISIIINDDIINYSQNILLFSLVYYMGFTTWSASYLRNSIFKTNPRRVYSKYIYISILLSILLQLLFFILSISISSSSFSFSFLSYLSVPFYSLLFLWPIFIILIDELFKIRQREWFNHHQKELKLEFDTRLGKYSPK